MPCISRQAEEIGKATGSEGFCSVSQSGLWPPLLPELHRLFAQRPDMIVKCADRDPVFYAPLAAGKAAGSALGDQLQPMVLLLIYSNIKYFYSF